LSQELTVRRDLGALTDINHFLDRFFKSSAGSEGARYAIELAVEEIFTNMVRHNAAGQGDITLGIDRSDGEIVATLTDFDAPRFDPMTDAPPPGIERQLEQRVPGGLGIHLVRKMIDQIEYSHQNRTARVILHKRVS
jgi:anti-sigma regulatory factor (Ser/Thr protein kinase)